MLLFWNGVYEAYLLIYSVAYILLPVTLTIFKNCLTFDSSVNSQ